jgi:hypothetical protein
MMNHQSSQFGTRIRHDFFTYHCIGWINELKLVFFLLLVEKWCSVWIWKKLADPDIEPNSSWNQAYSLTTNLASHEMRNHHRPTSCSLTNHQSSQFGTRICDDFITCHCIGWKNEFKLVLFSITSGKMVLITYWEKLTIEYKWVPEDTKLDVVSMMIAASTVTIWNEKSS